MNVRCPGCRTVLQSNERTATCSNCGIVSDLARLDTAPGRAAFAPDIDLSGESLGDYTLESILGSGGMGTVYAATHSAYGPCAVKVLSPTLAADPAARARFQREANALKKLKSEHIVGVLEEGDARTFCFVAMELVKGKNLAAALRDSGPLDGAALTSLARSLLRALDVVHTAGLVHRDIKPSNVLLANTGPKLCDFGIARFDGSATLTESAAIVGSLRYMAPEQRWGKWDDRSDLYALGVTLFEAASLGVPGEKELPRTVPRRVRVLIDRLTAQAARHRPASAREALRLLEPNRATTIAWAGAALVLTGAVASALITRESAVRDAPRERTLASVVQPIDASVVLANDVPAIDAGAPPLDEAQLKMVAQLVQGKAYARVLMLADALALWAPTPDTTLRLPKPSAKPKPLPTKNKKKAPL